MHTNQACRIALRSAAHAVASAEFELAKRLVFTDRPKNITAGREWRRPLECYVVVFRASSRRRQERERFVSRRSKAANSWSRHREVGGGLGPSIGIHHGAMESFCGNLEKRQCSLGDRCVRNWW